MEVEAPGERAGPRGITPEAVFSRLKPYCVELLDLLKTPRRTAPFLREMDSFLHETPGHILQPSLDYTLVPLLLLLDSAIQCRSTKEVVSNEGFGGLRIPLKGLAISDNVAEGVLMCLEQLLTKCHLGTVNQMAVILKKLALGALLSPSEASEEFREGIIRCFRVLLLRLSPCDKKSCTCRQTSNLCPFSSDSGLFFQPIDVSEQRQGPGECFLTFLRSQDASAAVGHWLSLLLQIAETEAARGLRGSAKLHNEAFLALRVLISRVGVADSLAFFLPGVVSRFSKALHITKNMISGAAGSTGSIDHAVRGLAEFLVIVLKDESNFQGLEESMNKNEILSCERKSSESVLKALRSLSDNPRVEDGSLNKFSADRPDAENFPLLKIDNSNNVDKNSRRLYVNRNKGWVEETSSRVNKLLSATFPNLCSHPSEKVRNGLVDAINGLLSNCNKTLKNSKFMLLECLCVLISDDSEVIASSAQGALETLFMLPDKLASDEIAEMLDRLIESLPKIILGNDETVAVAHAQKIFVLIYCVGPEFVTSHLFCSPTKAAQLFDILTLSFSQNSLFGGSVEKLILSKPLSVGYLQSVAELKAVTLFGGSNHSPSDPFIISTPFSFKGNSLEYSSGLSSGDNELPNMPPWFINVNSRKLYTSLAGILRLIGLSILSGQKKEVPLSVFIDNPLDCLHKLISEIRMKEYYKEDWNSWYTRNASGQLLRNASTAICVINEMIYGISDKSISCYTQMFPKTPKKITVEESQMLYVNNQHTGSDSGDNKESLWKVRIGKDIKDHVIFCVGSILHEYMAPEIWGLPLDWKSLRLGSGRDDDLPSHFFHDITILQQVIIEGIGIFGLSLGDKFKSSGFLQNSLYVLLQNILCSKYQIRTASDTSLRALSFAGGYSTVGNLIVSNADYIIDSLCRQLRHLDLSPHIPDVLAAMLSYVGIAHEILPLLEEPMRIVSLELEILGRHQHPNLTEPFLKAVGEINKASGLESVELPNKAESFFEHIKSELSTLKSGRNYKASTESYGRSFTTELNTDIKFQFEQWEGLLFKLNEMKRHRGIVGSIAESCLKSGIPLLGSKKESTCLMALDIVERGTTTLAKVEEAYKNEKKAKETIEEAMQLCSFEDIEDFSDAATDGDENLLLPAINKIWPYLVLCLKNKVSVAVMRRCMYVIRHLVEISGGDFFVRRFHNDGSVIWRLLTTSPFCRKPVSSREEISILLPYRNTSLTSEVSIAEVSSIKIQEAALNMIADLSRNKRSAAALGAVLKKVSGLVVGIACSNVTALRDASLKALSGLAGIDADLIWLLLADVYYSINNKDNLLPPPTSDFPVIQEVLPSPLSSKDYLYLQYRGENFGFDIDPSSVQIVFEKLEGECKL